MPSTRLVFGLARVGTKRKPPQLDSNFMSDSAKFISGMLMCLSVMYQMELPHVNVLTKMDVYERTMGKQKKADLEKYSALCLDLTRH